MSDTESFESVMSTLLDGFIHNVLTNQLRGPYDMIAANIERLRRAHDREIRDTAQREYDRGYNDGQHSMDAEHRAVAMRLRHLPLDGGSHENLSQIARAVYHADFGWTQGACMSLRDELVRLMGGVSDDTCGCAGGGACDADCGGDSGEQEEVDDGGRDSGKSSDVSHGGRCGIHRLSSADRQCGLETSDERLAHDCGADTGCGDGGGDLHLAGVTYDVLDNERRKAIANLRKLSERGNVWGRELIIALGLSIDASNDDMCDRLIHLLGGDQPSGIDVMNSYELRIEKLKSQRNEARKRVDELQAKLDAVTYYNGETKIEQLLELIFKDSQIEKLQAKLDAIRGALDAEP